MSTERGWCPTLRLTECWLLLWSVVLVGVGLTTLASVRQQPLTGSVLMPAVVFAAALLALHLFLTFTGSQSDQLLLPAAAGLAAVGLITVARLDPESLWRQTVWLGFGVGAAIVALVVLRDPSWIKRYRYTWAVLAILILAITFVFGRDPHGGGARLWISVAGVQFQPSEILKVLLVVFLAGYLDDKRELLARATYRLGPFKLPPLPYLGPLLVMWGIALAMLAVQKDLGLALLLFGLFLIMLYVASSRLLYVVGGLTLFALGGTVMYAVFYYVRVRVIGWLDPWYDPSGATYQISQSLLALANGGLLGTGLGRGLPNLIPAGVTDFPFAAISEELGLAGAVAVICLYLIVVFRGLRIAIAAFDPFQQLLAVGLTSVLGLQTFIIIAGSIKLIPLTGITLPFISYGGSSLLINFVAIGVLLAVSNRAQRRWQ